MKLNEVRRKSCHKCPYKLGTVETPINPCPQCKLNGYQSYEWLLKQLSGEVQKK